MNFNNYNIVLRDAEKEDAKLLFELRNDSEVCKNSINDKKISWNDHLNWYEKVLIDKYKKIYLFFCDNSFVGQVRIDIQDKNATINISIVNYFRGKGLAKVLLDKAIKRFSKENNSVDFIFAYIQKDNTPSIKGFENVGFKFEDQVQINDKYFNKYILMMR